MIFQFQFSIYFSCNFKELHYSWMLSSLFISFASDLLTNRLTTVLAIIDIKRLILNKEKTQNCIFVSKQFLTKFKTVKILYKS